MLVPLEGWRNPFDIGDGFSVTIVRIRGDQIRFRINTPTPCRIRERIVPPHRAPRTRASHPLISERGRGHPMA